MPNLHHTMEQNTEHFIEEIHKREVLWNKWNPVYKNRLATETAWEEMSRIFKKSREDVKQKWKNLRDSFQRELRRLKCSSSTDLGSLNRYVYTGKWCYFEPLLFLKDVMAVGEIARSDNADEVNNTSEEEEEELEEYQAETTKPQLVIDISCVQEQSNDAKAKPKRSKQKQPKKRKHEMSTFEKNFLQMMDQKITMLGKPYQRDQEDEEEIMHYLKSLVPYFKAVSKLRRLSIRSKIQDILLQELAESQYQSSSGASTPNND